MWERGTWDADTRPRARARQIVQTSRGRTVDRLKFADLSHIREYGIFVKHLRIWYIREAPTNIANTIQWNSRIRIHDPWAIHLKPPIRGSTLPRIMQIRVLTFIFVRISHGSLTRVNALYGPTQAAVILDDIDIRYVICEDNPTSYSC